MTMTTTLRGAAVSQVAEKLPSRALPPPSFPHQVRMVMITMKMVMVTMFLYSDVSMLHRALPPPSFLRQVRVGMFIAARDKKCRNRKETSFFCN